MQHNKLKKLFVDNWLEKSQPLTPSVFEIIDNIIYKPKHSEPLNENEKKFLSKVFNDTIKTELITKKFIYAERKEIMADFNITTHDIRFFDKFHDSYDFINSSQKHFSTFMHEMTHAWQCDSGLLNLKSYQDIKTESKQYNYKLEENKKFTDYSLEQQASIMEDYAVNYLHRLIKIESYTRRAESYQPELLKKTVEEQFPNTKKMRERLEISDIRRPRIYIPYIKYK